ncbi:hypothetical protein [Photobacterium kishitanii]|uniref:HD domain-containing protein n=1 Tax=Photobacterium kishitanii TaxID=318456 RepID=A0A2T3KLA5_9GAMM|nr:hypothetical protein [Photobacterium kishitanii]PSV00471.1 hypothetical protein C9J27_04885 [Photobacterium kishitanii]
MNTIHPEQVAVFNKFRQYAIEMHGDQMYGDQPYVSHLDRVRQLIVEFASQDECDQQSLEMLAIGHDLIEDTLATHDEITKRSSLIVAEAITLISDPVAESRAERKVQAYKRFTECTDKSIKQIAATGKFADRSDNFSSCIKDFKEKQNTRHIKKYLKEHREFMETYEPYCILSELKDCLNSLYREALSLVSTFEQNNKDTFKPMNGNIPKEV